MGENLEKIINDELNNDNSNTYESSKEDRFISLNNIERNKENRDKMEETLLSDNLFRTNILLFVAGFIFALYGIISILTHERIIANEEDNMFVVLSISSMIISLTVVDGSFGFTVGSIIRYKTHKSSLTNVDKMIKTFWILFALEILVFLTITIIGFINMDKSLFIGLSACPLIFGFILFMAIAYYVRPKVTA